MNQKPVILFFQFNLMSHFFRSLRLANELKEHYDVYIQSSEKYAKWLNESGLKSFECKDFNAEEALKKVGEFDFSWLNAHTLEEIFLEQVDVIKKFKATLVIGDTSFSLKMATEAMGVPYFSILNGYSTRFYQYTRTLSSSHPIAPYINWLPSFLLHPMVRIGEKRSFSLLLKEFKKVRNKHNLNITNHYLEELSGDQTFICDLPEMFPQKNLPNHHHIIGPLFHSIGQPKDPILEKIKLNKKTILLTMGSSTEWERFAFLNNKEYSIYNIIVVGENKNIMNASFLLKPSFVNYDEVLPKVDLVICHGGNGTLYQALSNKIPVLCYPSHVEQSWNVQRIEALGYGQSLEKVKTGDLSNAIKFWLERKPEIEWKLTFNNFNNEFQNKLFLDVVNTKGLFNV